LLIHNFRIIAFLENFEFELNFSNYSNYETFLKKVSHIIKKALFFVRIIFSIFVSNQQNTLFKMVTLNFCIGDHIFFMCSSKNHMTWFCDFWSKIFGNILNNSCSKNFELIFLESSAVNFTNSTFYFIQIRPCFVSLLLFILWIIIFATKLRFGKNQSNLFYIQNKWKKLTETCQVG
jgi:hypothetical protein